MNLIQAPSRRGFSLLEVTLALAIFGLGIVVLTKSFVNTLMGLEKVDVQTDYSGEMRFVRSHIIGIEDLEELEQGGELQTLSLGTARWQVEVEPTEVIDLFQTRISVQFEGRPEEVEPIQYEDTLYLLRPTWSDPVERSILLGEAKEALESERLTKDWY